MWYAETIRETAAKQGRIGYSPRLIEAWMRSEHGTLDAMTPEQFREEVEVACQLIDRNPALSETLAQSYGL